MKEAKLTAIVQRCQKAGLTPGSYDWNSMLANLVLGDILKVVTPATKDNLQLQSKILEVYEEFL